MQWTNEQAQSYLAAMIDGEGWIGEYKNRFNRAIRIANTEEEIITANIQCLEQLGITYTVIRDKKPAKPHWAKRITIEITRLVNLSYILEHVPFQSTRKRERLKRLIASYKVIEPLDVNEVRRLYTEKGMTDKQVAAAMGVGLKRVLNVRRKHNIAGHSYAERGPLIWAERRRRYGSAGRKKIN